MLPIIAILAFAAVALTVWGILRPTEDAIARRIKAGSTPQMARERRIQGGLGTRIIGPTAVSTGRLLAGLLPQNVVRSISHMLMMAGESMSLSAFLSLWVVGIALGLAILHIVVFSQIVLVPSFIPSVLRIIFGAYLFLFFALGPYLVVRRQVTRRQKSITRALPDALDLLVTCIEAGLAVDAAFVKVAEKTRGPISETFTLYLRQVGLGRSRRDALTDVAERTGVADLIRLAASVAQAEDMGITIGDVLRTQAGDLRLIRKQRAQEAAQKAPVKMSIPLVLCFMPAVFAVVVIPSILNIMRFVGGAEFPTR